MAGFLGRLFASRDVAVELRIPKPHTSNPKQALSGCGGVFCLPPSVLSKLGWIRISFWPGVTSLNELSEKYVLVLGPCAISRYPPPVPSSHSSSRSLLPRTYLANIGWWMNEIFKILECTHISNLFHNWACRQPSPVMVCLPFGYHTFLIYSTIGPAGSPALSWFVISLDIANKSVFIFSRAAWNSLLGLRWGLRLPNICVTCFLNFT